MISRIVIEKYRRAALELANELKYGKFKLAIPERAFIEWYMEARFGPLQQRNITDGKKDGGIDAIVDVGNITYVFQSKYETSRNVSVVSREDISPFHNLTRKFCNLNLKQEFDAWLRTTRPELRALYSNTYEKAQSNRNRVKFIFFTSKRCEFTDDEFYEIDDIQNISALWYLYSEGFTPPVDHIQLRLESSWFTPSNGFSTYVGLTEINSFKELMRNDVNERLFAQNVRTDLKSKINENIRKTYEEEPDIFWLCNNGIYIVCKKVQATGNIFTLTYPSIINGSQTLHAIFKSDKNHPCKILVRILEMDIMSDAKLLNSVVRRTNTQNTMKAVNLNSLDSFQLGIASYLIQFHIFYERREKEWINEKKITLPEYIPVKIGDVAQWLSIKDQSIGLGTARSQISSLFEESSYLKIFGNFGKDYTASCYTDLYCLVWIGLLVDNLPKHLPKELKSNAKMARLLLIKVIYNCISQSLDLQNVVRRLLEGHKYGKKSLPVNLIEQLTLIIKETIAIQQEKEVVDSKINYSNFFKRNDLVDLAYNKINTTELFSIIKSLLENNSAEIN